MNLRAIDKQEFTAPTRQKEARQVDGMSGQGRAGSVRMRAEPLAACQSRAAVWGQREPGGAGAGSCRRGSGTERVNPTPPCIEMLIVKIVYYLRKVI